VGLNGGGTYILTYANDVVILAESKEDLKEMIRRLKRYVEGKNYSNYFLFLFSLLFLFFFII